MARVNFSINKYTYIKKICQKISFLFANARKKDRKSLSLYGDLIPPFITIPFIAIKGDISGKPRRTLSKAVENKNTIPVDGSN